MKDKVEIIQKTISQIKILVVLCIKIRNQCRMVISQFIGTNTDCRKNGEEWLIESYLSEGDIVFDVGANTGKWAKIVQSSEPNTEIFCYEPHPESVEKFRDSISSSSRGKIHLFEKAVGSENGKGVLFVNPRSSEMSSLHGSVGERHKEIKVEKTTLDHELERLGISKVNFLKIDVEGWEGNVIYGSENILEEKRIECIQFEYGDRWRHTGWTLRHIASFLQEYGFIVFILHNSSLKRANIEVLREHFSYSNYVAVHKENIDKY